VQPLSGYFDHLLKLRSIRKFSRILKLQEGYEFSIYALNGGRLSMGFTGSIFQGFVSGEGLYRSASHAFCADCSLLRPMILKRGVSVTRLRCARTAKLIEVAFAVEILGDPRNIVLDGGPERSLYTLEEEWEELCQLL